MVKAHLHKVSSTLTGLREKDRGAHQHHRHLTEDLYNIMADMLIRGASCLPSGHDTSIHISPNCASDDKNSSSNHSTHRETCKMIHINEERYASLPSKASRLLYKEDLTEHSRHHIQYLPTMLALWFTALYSHSSCLSLSSSTSGGLEPLKRLRYFLEGHPRYTSHTSHPHVAQMLDFYHGRNIDA